MRSIYITGPWRDRVTLRALAEQVGELGWEVTSRWLDVPVDTPENEENSRIHALKDIEDIERGDVFVRMPSNGHVRSGGRFTETGYALRSDKPVIVVGPQETIFDALPQIIRLQTTEDLKRWLSLNSD